MVASFFRKLASRAKAKRKHLQPRAFWARPILESLDPRILPSVSATLKGGFLKVIADTHHGTSQVEIIQQPDQILVEDGGQVVNSFDPSQVQQINFNYREGHQQHTEFDLAIPVNQQQMTLTGFTTGEVDLTLGASSLTAIAHATLPDGTAVRLTGPVNTDGTYDLAGNALLIDVGSVPLLLPHFDLTDQGMTVEGHTVLPLVGAADFTGSLTPDGTYALTAPLPDFTVSGYTLTNASAALSNDGLGLTATTNVPIVGAVNVTGDLTIDGHYSLTASVPTVSVLGFTLTNVSVTLDDAHDLTFGAMATLPVVGDVTFTGSATPDGHYSLSAVAADFTLLGFTFSHATATLDNSGLTVAGDATIATDNWSGLVHFTGSVTPDGQYRLQGTATNVNFDGFISGSGAFTLTNSGLSFTGDITVGLDQGTVQVHFAGTLNANRQFMLVGQATTANFDGFISGNAVFTLNNSGMTAVGDITVGLDQGTVQVHFAGTVNVNHLFLLVGTATTTNFDGFISGDAAFTLSNAGMTVAGDLTVGLDAVTVQVHFMGTVSLNRQFQLTGTVVAGSTPQFDGYLSANATFTLNNSGMTVAGTLDVTLTGVAAHVQYTGTVDTNRQFALTGTLMAGSTADFNGFFSADAAFSFRNAGATITNGHLTFVMGSVTVTGMFTATVSANGSYVVTGTAQTNPLLDGFLVASASFRIDNANGLTFTGQVDLNRYLPGFPLITFSGWVHADHHYQITGQGPTFNILNFVTSSSHFTLSDSGDTFTLNLLNVLNVYTVTLAGTYQSNGQFSLTGTAAISLAGFSVASASFTLTNGGLSLSATVNVFVAQVAFHGSVQSNGTFSLSGTANVGLAGFSVASASFTLTNGGVTFGASINVFVATVAFSGSVDTHGNYTLHGSATAGFAGFGGSASFTLSNSGLTVSATVNAIVATVNVSGSISNTGTYSFMVSTRMGFAGFGASGNLTLNNGGVTVSATLDLGVLGVRMSVNGAVHSNGTYSFNLHAGLNWSVISASADFTLTQGGFSATLHAGFDVTAGVSFGPWSLRVGFRGSVDVGFSVHTDGTFSASGNVQACAYLGIGICVGIGFHLNTHQFCFNTSGIGFSLWGVSFHPFGDMCVGF